jgi:hypothetical protein
MLLAWIDALYCKEHGGCYASNEYFAKKLRLKENTINILISKLVKLGLVERVSFNGRQRILRACKENWHKPKGQSQADCDLNHMQHVNRITGSISLESHPSLYIDTSIDKRLEPPSIPPKSPPPEKKAANAGSAIASEEVDLSSQSKKEKIFSPEVKATAEKMLAILTKHNPVYRPPDTPDKLSKFLSHVKYLLENDKQKVDVLLKTFEWAVQDNIERGDFKGWQSVIYSKNPAETFRKHFAKIYPQMNSRAKRKWAEGTSDNLENYSNFGREKL